MFALKKIKNIQEKNKSMICLGLDLDPKKMPSEYGKSIKSMHEFAMQIVKATSDVVCAYKPNMAFFEVKGHEGMSLLESICDRIPSDVPIIMDGKRGDIGNTASFYAEAMYDRLHADWVTLNPYMGYDSLRPFLEHKDKGIFVLCLTSNTGSKDFQLLDVGGKPLYKVVAEKVDYWNKENNCGLVIGATNPEQLKEIRDVAGSMPLLIPGVGAQGGSLEKAVLYGTNEFKDVAVINVSRSVLYASNGEDFAEKAREEVLRLNKLVERIQNGERDVEGVTLEEVHKSVEQTESSQAADDQPTTESARDNKVFIPAQKSFDPEPKTSSDSTPPVSSEEKQAEPAPEVESTATSDPVEPAESAEPIEPAEPVESTPTDEPVKPAEEVKPFYNEKPPEIYRPPIDSPKPVEPTSSTETTEESKPVEEKPVKEVKPYYNEKPPEIYRAPNDSSKPVEPTSSTDTAEESKPVEEKPEERTDEKPAEEKAVEVKAVVPTEPVHKEPPPMPKPPPPLPPVPPIPRFDKPPSSNQNQNRDRNRQGNSNRHNDNRNQNQNSRHNNNNDPKFGNRNQKPRQFDNNNQENKKND